MITDNFVLSFALAPTHAYASRELVHASADQRSFAVARPPPTHTTHLSVRRCAQENACFAKIAGKVLQRHNDARRRGRGTKRKCYKYCINVCEINQIFLPQCAQRMCSIHAHSFTPDMFDATCVYYVFCLNTHMCFDLFRTNIFAKSGSRVFYVYARASKYSSVI